MSGERNTGNYRLLRVIGSGAMGVVYEAWDERLARRVALKLLHPHLTSEPVSAARLEREARLGARVEHPNVVRVYRIDRLDEQLAIEMQFIDGSPLHALMANGPLSIAQAVNLLAQVLNALGACHAQGVIHCDLKPGNLLVTAEGHVYLTDFGISRAAQENEASGTNAQGSQWGTPRYSPPEAWHGETPTVKWDLYSAGAVLYEALSGTIPYSGQTSLALMRRKLEEDLSSLRSIRPEISVELSDLVGALMARDPSSRPRDARRALDLLRATLEYGMRDEDTQPLEAIPAPAPPAAEGNSASSPVTKPRRRWGLSAAGILAMGALALALLENRIDSRHEPNSAPRAASMLPTERIGDSVAFNGRLYFALDDGIHGSELWCTTPDVEGVELVADLNPGPGSSNPRHFLIRQGIDICFSATTPEHGEELWLCNGVEYGSAGIRMVKDIIPGPMSSKPDPVAIYDNLILFYAISLAEGRELWCTNGQADQTALVTDLCPGSCGSEPSGPVIYQDGPIDYFVGYGQKDLLSKLWRFDFRQLSITEIATVAENTMSLGKAGSVIVLGNSDKNYGQELWIHDPERGGIQLLADIYPGPESSWPSQFFAWKGMTLFQARSKEHGKELYRTDGTASGTALLADIDPGPGDSDPYGFVAAGDRVFFRAKDASHAEELWMTDGQPGGTRLVVDLRPGPASSAPYNLAVHGNQLFFSANDGVHGEELWGLDVENPESTVRLVADLLPGPANSEPHNLTWVDAGRGIFVAKDEHGLDQLTAIAPRNGAMVARPVSIPGPVSEGTYAQ